MRGSRVALAIVACIALAVLRWRSAPAWPDDWDGVGFVLAITKFDLTKFQPHPPGYPAYVAMLKAAAIAVRDPIAAANVVAVGCGAAAAFATWAAAKRATSDASRATWVAIFTASVPLAWRAGSAIGSEAPALACFAIACLGLAMEGSRAGVVLGLAVGVGLGVRLSWAPLFVALLAIAPREMRARAIVSSIAATFAWLVPFVAIVGPRALVTTMSTHASGHFTVWGGTVVKERGLLRVVDLARDVFVDGMGGGADGLGLAILVGVASIAVMGLQAWRDEGWAHARTIALALAPYAIWIAFGQNVHDQPRHALPLVVALAAGLALAATSSTRARTGGGVLLALIALRTFTDAHDRLEKWPSGAQLVQRVRELPDASKVAVYGGPSVRFFELARDVPAHAETVGSIGDAELSIGRLDSLPSRVLVTSELADLDAVKPALTPFAVLCRPARIDRRAPCLRVFEWHRR